MKNERTERKGVASTAAIQKLESLERAGVKQLPKPGRRKIARPQGPSVAAAVEVAVVPLAGDSLDIIRQEVAACRCCAELAATRTQTVFGVGNPKARLCFLGEAPGADEDKQGEPFVGRAGQLLTKIIEACTLSRSDVFILNVLKCRPPGNRTPLPDEVANCRGFLDRQLQQIQPEYICCLGAVAAQTLLQTDTPISRMRGKFFDYQGISVMCTYHPAYLLRNPAAKKDVWEDMKVLMRKMGIELG
jgi:uracil-DNA glycosylase